MKNLFSTCAVLALSLFLLASSAMPQSPSTSALVVTVVDPAGAVVPGAKITVSNNETGADRNASADDDGTATFAALPLTGHYTVTVSNSGFSDGVANNVRLRSGETAAIRIALAVGGGTAEVTIYGTTEGVRADAQIGRRFDPNVINESPILGRKLTSITLFNSAFRSGKGTGDLFVNQTYFVTGVGSRRATTYSLDGGNNDESWGRQTATATVPIGAVQEVTVLSNAFSADFGGTSASVFNVVTKSGTNEFHGEGVFTARPGGMQAKSFKTTGYCPTANPNCVVPSTLAAISPVDVPDKLFQYSGAIGGPIYKDKTFFFVAGDYTRQDRTTFLSNTLPSFSLPAGSGYDYTGHYRQSLLNARIDHKLATNQNLMFRFNLDRMMDDNPQDTVGGSNAPSVARTYQRDSWTMQLNHTWVIASNILNEARVAYLHGSPVARWNVPNASTVYTRGSGNGAVPFTIGQARSSDIWGRQVQFADTLSWTHGIHSFRFGGSVIHHRSGGYGAEFGSATLGTFTFLTTNPARNTLPFDQLTLADVQNYSQPINFGVSDYKLSQWIVSGFAQDSIRVGNDLVVDLGLRYDRQTLTTAKKNFEPRIGFGWHPGGNSKLAVRGGYGMYYTQIRSNVVANYLISGLDGGATYTATPGQVGFPTCLTGSCLPVNVDPRTIPSSQLPARDITIIAGKRDFYKAQFANYGLNFDALASNYSDKFVNPRSQVFSIGSEYEIFKGFFAGADYVHQHLDNIDRTVDLNAPSEFDRTAAGQMRTAAAANLTRPIFPTSGGVRQVNAIMNFGVADYDGLQTSFVYRGPSRLYASLSYTLSKATNTTEPDGNGIGPDQSIITRLGEQERGLSLLDQRHRAVITVSYRFPWGFTAGTLSQFGSARPFSATTGVDNNGDGIQNDRPFVNGRVLPRSSFRGRGTQDVSIFVENKIKLREKMSLTLRLEGFNMFNYANMLARGVTVYGNTETPNPDFGLFSNAYSSNGNGTVNAIPAFANIDPPRMFQLQARFSF